jgi:hypothetical protein
MPTAVASRRTTRYHAVFPDWHTPQPLGWYFVEQLLEARAGSAWPTNGDRPDEDVNVYLAHLLEGFVAGGAPVCGGTGAAPLWHPPTKTLGRRQRAERYRAAADHRLLALGLCGRGDLARHRTVLHWRSAAETRDLDLETGRRCYDLAANLLAGRGGALAGLAPVLRKLADGFEDYVQVLSVLARRRLGLGAVLGEAELAGLLRGPEPAEPAATMDDLLDLVNDWRRAPDPALAARIARTARDLGVDPGRLGMKAAG